MKNFYKGLTITLGVLAAVGAVVVIANKCFNKKEDEEEKSGVTFIEIGGNDDEPVEETVENVKSDVEETVENTETKENEKAE